MSLLMGKDDARSREEQPTREERLAARLRENLKRRKVQSRQMAAKGTLDAGDSPEPPLPKGESTG